MESRDEKVIATLRDIRRVGDIYNIRELRDAGGFFSVYTHESITEKLLPRILWGCLNKHPEIKKRKRMPRYIFTEWDNHLVNDTLQKCFVKAHRVVKNNVKLVNLWQAICLH